MRPAVRRSPAAGWPGLGRALVDCWGYLTAPSSSGLGHHPLKVAARVRIPLGLPQKPWSEARAASDQEPGSRVCTRSAPFERASAVLWCSPRGGWDEGSIGVGVNREGSKSYPCQVKLAATRAREGAGADRNGEVRASGASAPARAHRSRGGPHAAHERRHRGDRGRAVAGDRRSPSEATRKVYAGYIRLHIMPALSGSFGGVRRSRRRSGPSSIGDQVVCTSDAAPIFAAMDRFAAGSSDTVLIHKSDPTRCASPALAASEPLRHYGTDQARPAPGAIGSTDLGASQHRMDASRRI